MAIFNESDKVIVIGDRDGIPGPAMEECVKTTPAEVIFSATECFVWTAAGAMDLENQSRVKDLTEEYGAENVIVLLGGAEPETTALNAETVTGGDPTYAGPLAGVPLGLRVYHVTEPDVKAEFDEGVYMDQIGMMEMVLDVDAIADATSEVRDQFTQY